MAELIERNLNFTDPEEVLWAAKNYCLNPGYWENTWKVAEKVVDQTVARINAASRDQNQCLLIAESATGEKIVFHWLRLEHVEPDSQRYVGIELNDSETVYAQIIHLWVHDDHNGRGLAKILKTRGEAWALANGAARIQTSVNYRNKKMFDLNLRLGFEAGNVVMSKKL